MRNKLLNFGLFQIVWLAAALGAGRGIPWLGVLVAALALTIHFRVVATDAAEEARFVFAAALIGALVDTLQALAGVFSFHHGAWLPWLCPPWLFALWLAFASTLRHSLGWLRGRYVTAALFAAAGGPLAYYAGHRFGAMAMPADVLPSLAVMAVVWALLMPALLWLSGVLTQLKARRLATSEAT